MPNTTSSSRQGSSIDSGPTHAAAAHFSANTLTELSESLAREHQVARTLGDDGNSHYVLVNRTQSAAPERHARWMDVMFVRSGGATMMTGGRMEGAVETAPGEESGGTIVGGESRQLAPGDLLVIPAGVPHQILLAAGESIQYITVKVPNDR